MSEIVHPSPLPEHPEIPGDDTVVSDAERLAHEPPTTCLNCGAVLPGQFCPACGQRDQAIRQPAHVFIAESVSEYFGLDGRLWRSLGLLLFQPGALTEAYLEGRRTRYLRPLRLYLTATVLFFFLLSFLDPLQGGTRSVRLEPVAADSTLRAEVLIDRLDERSETLRAERDAVLSAAALVPNMPRGDSLRRLGEHLSALDSSLVLWEDSLGRADADSLVAVATLPLPVAEALRDTGRVDVAVLGPTIAGGLQESVPEWAKGDLARRMEESESPAERQLLMAQYQRAILRQVPTALFVVLPVFALLLKLLYLGGAGRQPRHRPRPVAPTSEGKGVWYALYQLSDLRWRFGRWKEQRRIRKRRWKRRQVLAKARKRRVRSAIRETRAWVAALPLLRPWRVRRLRSLRAAVRTYRSPYFSEHLVFGLHVHAYAFLVGGVLVWIAFLNAGVSTTWDLVGVGLGCTIPLYFLLAQKRVYRETWLRTILKASVLGFSYVIVVATGTLLAAALALRLG